MEAWRLRGDTVTLNSCLRSWPWRRGMAMMATSQVGSDLGFGTGQSNKFWAWDQIKDCTINFLK